MSDSDYNSHPCESPGCKTPVIYDDEPFCFEHSPDSGSHVSGYSYTERMNKKIDKLHGAGAAEALDRAIADGSIFG